MWVTEIGGMSKTDVQYRESVKYFASKQDNGVSKHDSGSVF